MMSKWIVLTIFVVGYFAFLFVCLWVWINFVAWGNWLSEEERYVRWRHYAAVKLKLRKPMQKDNPKYDMVLSPHDKKYPKQSRG